MVVAGDLFPIQHQDTSATSMMTQAGQHIPDVLQHNENKPQWQFINSETNRVTDLLSFLIYSHYNTVLFVMILHTTLR